MNATDAADYLVSKGLPFRQAHEVIGTLVRYCLEQKKRLDQLSVDELGRYSPLFEKDFSDFITLDASLQRRGVIGGTAPDQVRKAIQTSRASLKQGERIG